MLWDRRFIQSENGSSDLSFFSSKSDDLALFGPTIAIIILNSNEKSNAIFWLPAL